VLNFNEAHKYDNLLTFTAVSSGFHIGSANWSIEVGQTKLGVITNASFGVDYRHPMPFNGAALKNADCMVISSVVLQANRPSFDSQMKNLLDKLTHCLDSSLNAKVLMPIQPYFVLEIVDLILHKLYENVKIVFISESAQPLIEYSNINLAYLNPMLQGKIYNTENPLSFDKLINSGRLTVYKDIQEYL
jgi:Cft2 family RNA processing exonuclease